MKKMALIAAFVIALLPVVAFAEFEIILKNTAGEKLVYSLEWIDHPFGMHGPAIMAGGELEAGKENRLEYKYKPGKYRVSWFGGNSKKNYPPFTFTVKENPDKKVKTATITPESVSFDAK